MTPRTGEAACRNPARSGFTLAEAVIVLLIVAVVIGVLTPGVVRQLQDARTNRAANVVAASFFQAQSLAGRQHTPVVIAFDGASMIMTISQPPPTSTVLTTRRFGLDSEFKLTAFSASPTSVLVLPNGMTNGSVTVTLTGGSYARQVRMTRAGQVRVM